MGENTRQAKRGRVRGPRLATRVRLEGEVLHVTAQVALLPTNITQGQAPGMAFRIEGQLLPVLHLAMNGQMPVYFEHHVVLWKQPQVNVGVMPLKGAFRRLVAGMPIFMTQASGYGEIAFSRDSPGQVFPLEMRHGTSILVREHQFMAATANLGYTFERIRGIGSMLFGHQGFWQDRFDAMQGDGVLWLHAYGNAFEVVLQPGEMIDVEPGSWIYRDPQVGYSQQVFGLKTGILGGGGNLVFNRFAGPGRVGLQSGYFNPGPADAAGGAAIAGGIIGGLLSG
jgi:uncharacterized protein (AIM24 family)